MVQKVYKAEWGFQFADTLEEARDLLAKAPQEANPP
jgi:hypothetical protein